MLRVFLCLALILGCQCFQRYLDEIPNANYVPNPCKDNSLWRGLGHKDPEGGGPRDEFGSDFVDYDRKWTKVLCEIDSDGDGKSNGEELGDPDCVWTKGTPPSRNSNISHPGICDPWGSEDCADSNMWVSCDESIFNCTATSDPDVKNFTLRFPPTNVPAQWISARCMAFLRKDYLDMSQDYHLVANKPLINNSIVLRQIIIYGCSDKARLTTTAKPCSAVFTGCNDRLAMWTPGLLGTCEHKDAGFLIGKNSYEKMALQIMWANPEQREGYVDSSGLTFYFTPKLRRHNIGMMMTTQMYLNIPPGAKRSVFESSCSEDCTKKLIKDTIYLTSGFSRMNSLGYTQTVDQIRKGETVLRLINHFNYSLDNPKFQAYTSPIEFRPGDELKTMCVYRSESKTRTTLYGDGANDEQCSNIFFYFPKENLKKNICHQWKSLDLCELKDGRSYNGCDFQYFSSSSDQFRTINNEVMDSCNHWGPCRPECPAVVNRIKKNPCFQGLFGEFMLSFSANKNDVKMIKFAQALVSCDHDVTPCVSFPSSSASLPASSLFFMLFLFFLSL